MQTHLEEGIDDEEDPKIGCVPVNYPYRNVDLFQATSRADLADFIAEPRRS